MPFRLHAIVTAVLLATCSAPLHAQASPAPYRVSFQSEQYDLPRSSNGVAYRLFVRHPIRAPEPGEQAIAIYVLDAQWNFPAVAAMHANSEALGHLPPIYYIGVSYQNEEPGELLEANRTRDYTPTAFRPVDPASHFLRPEGYEGSGGADAFLTALEKEIVPFVERRFPVDSTIRGIVGKSMGGLLATHALLTRPNLFSHYLIISPALWWDDYFLPYPQRAVMRTEGKSHAQHMARPTHVWIGMGEGEERLGMLADVYVLGRSLRLRSDPNLDLTIRLLPGEIHESVFATGFATGLRALFPMATR
jgi:uncharacterized protein